MKNEDYYSNTYYDGIDDDYFYSQYQQEQQTETVNGETLMTEEYVNYLFNN